MSVPATSINKSAFSATQAPGVQLAVGTLGILACSGSGTENQPVGMSRSDICRTTFGDGPLTEFSAEVMAIAGKAVVTCKGHAGNAGTYGTINVTGVTGTSVVTNGATAPLDHYAVVVKMVAGCTVGVAGGTYTYSLDGGKTTSAVQALGTLNTLTIPNSGVSFALAAGTLIAGDTWSVSTERPTMSNTDVTAALTAMATSRLPMEGYLIDCTPDTSTVGLIDTHLAGLEAKGIFRFAIINGRMKNEPSPATESEAAYLTAMTTLFGAQTSIRVCAGADGGHTPSQITGYNIKRPTALHLAARAMLTGIGEDAAYVGRGALDCQIADANGNPSDHDEDLNPGLDAQRLVTLRSFAPGGPQGIYITNPNVIQPTGGQFPYLQHIRIANVACTIAWATLTTQLSRGVRKNLKADPVTGAVYIYEPDAAAIESLVNDALVQPLKGQVTAAKFSLSRTDDMNATPCVVTGVLSVVALAYIKGYQVQFQFSKTLQSAI